MKYEMPKMDIMELEKENMISTLTSTTASGGGSVGFEKPEEDDDF